MGWRNVMVSNPAVLSLDQNRLVVARQDQPGVTVPLEDIASIVLDHPQITVTAPLLTALCAQGASLIPCDSAHTPCGALLPSGQHSRALRALQYQLGASLPFLKNCWKRIVQQKLRNQARCLEIASLPEQAQVRALASQVKSGDSDNRESVAAAVTFSALFPGLKRREGGVINAAINYGYAVMRACVARNVTAYGFQSALGIHHCSVLNAFNLADDLLEPLRPVVDLWTFMHMREAASFEKEHRLALVRLLAAVVRCGDEEVAAQRGCEVMCASFVTACREKDPQRLALPELLNLRTWHE